MATVRPLTVCRKSVRAIHKQFIVKKSCLFVNEPWSEMTARTDSSPPHRFECSTLQIKKDVSRVFDGALALEACHCLRVDDPAIMFSTTACQSDHLLLDHRNRATLLPS